jgi:hypothetical protein
MLNLVAMASSQLPVSFASLSTSVCTVSGNVASLTNTGTCTIQATQGGNGTYAPAQPVNQSFMVLAAGDFTISARPGKEARHGDHPEFAVTLQSVNGFDGEVRLGCEGGPAGSSCEPGRNAVLVDGTVHVKATLNVPEDTPPGDYTITFKGVSGSLMHSVTVEFKLE